MLTVTLAYIANLNITELIILTISDNIGQSLLDDFGEGAISAYQRQVDFCDLFSPPGVKLFQTRSGTCHSTRPCRSSFPHWSIDPLLCEFLGSKDLRFRDSIHFSSWTSKVQDFLPKSAENLRSPGLRGTQYLLLCQFAGAQSICNAIFKLLVLLRPAA